MIDPRSAEAVARVALASAEDVDAAIDAAADSFPAWAALSAAARGDLLIDSAALLAARADEVAATLAGESGKTSGEASAEVQRAVETLAWNGAEASRVEGRLFDSRVVTGRRLSLPTPLGVVAAFTPWNFPAVLTARKLGAALAAGCTVVLKGSEATPATAAAVVATLVDAGVPAGVVNLLFGDPAAVSKRMICAPAVRAVTFTGSTSVGRIVAGHAASGLKRTVLELGGHAPVIVAGDADVDYVIATTLPAKFGSAGQSCVAPSRYFVESSLYEEFVAKFTEAVRRLEPGVDVGPLINPGRVAAMKRLTDDAVRRGAKVTCGGSAPDLAGYFWAPTILRDVPDAAEIMSEEPFGPVACVAAFDDLDDAIARA
ncbi:MAG TPA: aldehyde dehydrogenase family protein, partial [Solirubrobacterales bacterium]|nr:aldehyde dehydrogenase family protein [Solirubrobacterales bacterium]